MVLAHITRHALHISTLHISTSRVIAHITAKPQVRLPGFNSEAVRRMWLEEAARRGLGPQPGGEHIGMHLSGQNFILRNVRWMADKMNGL